MNTKILRLANKFAALTPMDDFKPAGRYSLIEDGEEPDTQDYSMLPESALQEIHEAPMRSMPPPLPNRRREHEERGPMTQRSPMNSDLMGNVAVNSLMSDIRSLLMDIEDENKSGNYLVAKDMTKKLTGLCGDMYDHFRTKSR